MKINEHQKEYTVQFKYQGHIKSNGYHSSHKVRGTYAAQFWFDFL